MSVSHQWTLTSNPPGCPFQPQHHCSTVHCPTVASLDLNEHELHLVCPSDVLTSHPVLLACKQWEGQHLHLLPPPSASDLLLSSISVQTSRRRFLHVSFHPLWNFFYMPLKQATEMTDCSLLPIKPVHVYLSQQWIPTSLTNVTLSRWFTSQLVLTLFFCAVIDDVLFFWF